MEDPFDIQWRMPQGRKQQIQRLVPMNYQQNKKMKIIV
jgi:hypothetical protein